MKFNFLKIFSAHFRKMLLNYLNTHNFWGEKYFEESEFLIVSFYFFCCCCYGIIITTNWRSRQLNAKMSFVGKCYIRDNCTVFFRFLFSLHELCTILCCNNRNCFEIETNVISFPINLK